MVLSKGLHGTLKVDVEARVMLTTLVDVSDGLVNGAWGKVVTNSSNKVTSILVKFENSKVGLQTRQYWAKFANAVQLNKYEVVFFAKDKRGSEIKWLQFPLTLAWATTIHKVQGPTFDEILVDMEGGRFSPGQPYESCENTSWPAYPTFKSYQEEHWCWIWNVYWDTFASYLNLLVVWWLTQLQCQWLQIYPW